MDLESSPEDRSCLSAIYSEVIIFILIRYVFVYTRILKKSYRGSETPENHVIIKESAAWRSELVDSDALDSAFFR